MAQTRKPDGPATGEEPKRCFVVSAFGSTPEERKRTKQVLRHLVRKVLEPQGYKVIRADEIDDEGLITNQIIERLLEDDLVVADLTGANPNVFYELAVRHAARKPIIHLITAGETIPFDVANMRAITYALDDPDLLEEAQRELARKVASIEQSDGAGPNPITAARDVWLLRGSDEPQVREAGELLAMVSDLRDEMRALARRVAPPSPSPPLVSLSEPAPSIEPADRMRTTVQFRILKAIALEGPLTIPGLAEHLRMSRAAVSRAVERLVEQGLVEREGALVRLGPNPIIDVSGTE
jgi:predicted transcriptional regulator